MWFLNKDEWYYVGDLLKDHPNPKLEKECVKNIPLGQGENCFDDYFNKNKRKILKEIIEEYYD